MDDKLEKPVPSARNTRHAYDDVPILVHVGPHKTGTSWLQKALFNRSCGIIYELKPERSHAAFLHPAYGEFSSARARELYAPLLARAQKEQKPLIISDEALGGRPFGQRFVREIAAERIALTFPHARILITTREQDAILLSMYSEYLRYGYSSSLRAFLEQNTGNPNIRPHLDLRYYEWDRFLKTYETFFPKIQVLAIPMEWGLLKPENYAVAITDFLKTPLGEPGDLSVQSVERPSLSGWGLRILRYANRIHPQDTRYLHKKGWFSPNSLAFQVNRFTPQVIRIRSTRSMRLVVREMIGDRFVQSNRAFQARTKHDLADLSYRLRSTLAQDEVK